MNTPSDLIFVQNMELAKFSAIRVGGKSAWHTTITDLSQVPILYKTIQSDKRFISMKVVPVGSGTNTFFGSGKLNILSIENNLLGREVINKDNDHVTVAISSGEDWDSIVEWTVSNGWSGIESLSAIPGTVGAAPVQNIGAYGTEISDVLESVSLYDLETGEFRTCTNSECQFEYRDSVFKQNPGRYFITSITLKLNNNDLVDAPTYKSVVNQFNGQSKVSIKEVRQVITDTRWSKLPKPDILPNCGSWFKNPIITSSVFNEFMRQIDHLGYTEDQVSFWKLDDGTYKVAAGWLVEQAVGKDYCDKYFCTYGKNALVIINPTLSPSTKKLLKFEKLITDQVFEKFSVKLEREPILVE